MSLQTPPQRPQRGIWYYTDEKGEEVLYALTVHRHAQRLNVAASLRLRMDGSDIRERKKWRSDALRMHHCGHRLLACVCVCVCVQIAVIACVQSLVRFLPVISCALIAVVAFV